MNRRYFIAFAGLGVIEAPTLRKHTLPTTQSPKWQPDGAGTLGRIGVLTPDFDPVPESEMWAMVPPGVSIHAARVPWTGEARAFAEPPHVDRAVEQLAGLAPRVILYAFTSSSYALGTQADDALRVRLEQRAGGIPVLLTCPTATEALRVLGAHRIAVIHPPWFPEELNAQGRDYFRTQGFEVVLCKQIAPGRPFTEVRPAEVYEWARRNVPRQADAVFIGGNGLRAVGATHALEERLGRPVLTANQVLLWQALRLVGVTSKVSRYGRVFTAVP
jgi:maleate isomerase